MPDETFDTTERNGCWSTDDMIHYLVLKSQAQQTLDARGLNPSTAFSASSAPEAACPACLAEAADAEAPRHRYWHDR
eukprot:6784717-Pyramimonas_sp.AAC.1